MTEPQKFQPVEESEEGLKDSDKLQRPKNIIKKNLKNDPLRSKSAPAEPFENDLKSNDYLDSYNYYIYYNNLKKPDPRIPKPTYKENKEKSKLDFIKETKDKEEEEDDILQDPPNDKLLGGLTNDLNNLNLQENNSQQNPDPFSQNLFNKI